MDKIKVDLLREKYALEDSPRKPFLFFAKVFLSAVVAVATVGGILSYQVASTSDGTNQFPRLSLFSTIKHLVTSGDRELAGEDEDRINILLMGIGGEGHSGPQLTDTMIFASYRPSDGKVGMISIPRDLNVPIPGYGWRKVNHANAFGEMDAPGSGPQTAIDVLKPILKQDIHYYVRVDFEGFSELVDDIGGVNVNVERSFTDNSYPSHGKEYEDCGTRTQENEEGEEVEVPVYGCRFETISFEKGWTEMDGDTALKFVRSRHGNNGEASDFARARRQQNVLTAVKDEIFSASTILNPARVNRILDTLEGNIATNLTTWELIRFGNIVKDLEREDIVSHVLDSSEDSPLYATSRGGAYVLLPKNDDWRPVTRLAENIFTQGSLSAAMQEAARTNPAERFPKVEIQNGTDITGFAFRTSQLLDGQGYDVVKIGNAAERGRERTAIYDFTDGARSDELKRLRDSLDADVTLSATGWLATGDVIPDDLEVTSEEFRALATAEGIDFLVILGEDSARLITP